MARARAGASPLLKMPEPTKTPSTPICIMRAASAGVATPPVYENVREQLHTNHAEIGLHKEAIKKVSNAGRCEADFRQTYILMLDVKLYLT